MTTIAIPLASEEFFAIVDKEDYQLISKFKWHRSGNNRKYAATSIPGTACKGMKRKRIYMHVLIMGTTKIDHKDGNGLNNSRLNLRKFSGSQNNANSVKKSTASSSKYKGVSFVKDKLKWRAGIKIYGKSINLGDFDSELLAAQAYDIAAIRFFGKFAKTNLIRL